MTAGLRGARRWLAWPLLLVAACGSGGDSPEIVFRNAVVITMNGEVVHGDLDAETWQ
jgi:hypothetical protein